MLWFGLLNKATRTQTFTQQFLKEVYKLLNVRDWFQSKPEKFCVLPAKTTCQGKLGAKSNTKEASESIGKKDTWKGK